MAWVSSCSSSWMYLVIAAVPLVSELVIEVELQRFAELTVRCCIETLMES